MKEFAYAQAATVDAALKLSAGAAGAKYLGGGTNLVDLMRENIETPHALIDITRMPAAIEARDSGLRIGAAVKNSQVALDRHVRQDFPFLSQAILFGASGQIRNMATVGGNLLQRTRCSYFYDLTSRCNKRQPGSGCDAAEGFNRNHAVLGWSPSCIAVFPSDMCVALAALDATVNVEGPGGARSIAFADFHRLPGDTPHIENALAEGELITSIDIEPCPEARNSLYRKIRDRASYAFALVSVATALAVENGTVKAVRIALGGVAHKPWRAAKAEAMLIGAAPTEANFRAAAEAEMADARGFAHNAFKIELTRRAIVEALSSLAAEGAVR